MKTIVTIKLETELKEDNILWYFNEFAIKSNLNIKKIEVSGKNKTIATTLQKDGKEKNGNNKNK
jgi:hypothetical protein